MINGEFIGDIIAGDYREYPNYLPFYTITSIEILRYSYNLQIDKNLCMFFDQWRNLNVILREKKVLPLDLLALYASLIDFIDRVPLIKYDVVLWRGVSKLEGLKYGINQEITDQGFLHCSLDRKYAELYKQDTSECYSVVNGKLTIDRGKIKESKDGALIKIIVPQGSKFLDVSYPDICCMEIKSEIILSPLAKFKVIEINSEYQTWQMF